MSTQFDSSGNPYSSIPNPALDSGTIAAIQKSLIAQPGFYGNQELKNSHVAFNRAAETAASVSGYATLLKNNPLPSKDYKRTDNNYILTTLEKAAIERKANEPASFGVVPYDTLEHFFYILAGIDSLYNLQYIAAVTGIDELGDRKYIRNIYGITGIPNIYKIGYLANAVPAINRKYASQFRGYDTASDYYQSSTGNISYNANYANQLGVIGQVAISVASNFVGPVNILSNAPPLSSSAILNSVNVMSGYASGATLAPTTIGAILNPTATAQSFVKSAGAQAIGSLLSMTPIGGALGSFGSLGGVVAGMVLGQTGGYAVGSYMSQALFGKRISASQRANNPNLIAPSYAGKSFFGEAPVSMPAIDQVFCRRVGAFGSTTGGNGTLSFSMQNFASFGGSMSVTSLVSRMLTGSMTPPSSGTFYGNSVLNTVTNVCNILNVPTTSTIEPRRSDNAIPFMLGMSAAIVGESFTPHGSTCFTDGWKLASSTANDVQKYNPGFLNTCRTSL